MTWLRRVDLAGPDVLKGGTLDTHWDVQREAPDSMVAHGLLPLGVLHLALHQRELVALVRLDNAVEAVHCLAIIVLGDLLAAVLVADEDPLLAFLGLGRLARRRALISGLPLCLLDALPFQHLLKGDPVVVREVTDRLQVALVLLPIVVRLVEGCEQLHLLLVSIVLPALERQLARAALRVVRACRAIKNGLRGILEPCAGRVLVIDRALDQDGGHLAARLVLLVVDGHHGHRQLLVGVEAALEAGGGGAAAGLPLLVQIGENRIRVRGATALEDGVDVATDIVARGVRDLLEHVEELGVQGGGHFDRGVLKKLGAAAVNFNHPLLCCASLTDRLLDGDGLLLGLEPDKTCGAGVGLSVDVVEQPIGRGPLDA